MPLRFTLIVLALVLSACAQYENKRGVEVGWQGSFTESLGRGQTTRSDVLRMLGPPSQVISLQDETVLYYLFEHAEGQGLILLAYNRFAIETGYDRAIFFFDQQDLLTDYATHIRD